MVLLGSGPSNNAKGVAVDKISVTFLESGAGIDPSTLTTNTFQVYQVTRTGNVQISGKVSYDEAYKTVTFTPSSKLSKGQSYLALISPNREVEDKADNTMSTHTWRWN